MNLKGKTIIISGASAGIGAATARALAKRGANLVLLARREARLEGLVTELAELPGERICLAGDVGEREFCTTAVAQTLDRFGRVDILINNAGVGHNHRLLDIPEVDARRLLDTNLLGLLWLTQAAGREMVAQQSGQIINVASIVSYRPLANAGLYSASKVAVDFIGRSLHLELRGSGVRVTTVYPGLTSTEFHAVLLGKKRQGPHRFRWFGSSAELVGEKVARAVERRPRQVFITPIDWLFCVLNRHFPGVFDLVFGRTKL